MRVVDQSVNWWWSNLGTARRNSSNYLSPISQSGQVMEVINEDNLSR